MINFNLKDIAKTKENMIEFEREIAQAFQGGRIKAPVHFSAGNEEKLIKIFRGLKPTDQIFNTRNKYQRYASIRDYLIKTENIEIPNDISDMNAEAIQRGIRENDWVFTSYRSHYHFMLKGMPIEELREKILEGRSMYLMSKEYKIFTTAIVPGQIPIALGMASGIKRSGIDSHVWAFCGDMAAETGIFEECSKYAENHALPITYVIEDNGLSVDTPTEKVWGKMRDCLRTNTIRYAYKSLVPHQGIGKEVGF